MTDAGGLRERKRAATRRALQIALLEAALARGLDAVTVDEVCRAAQVSPRTFFNYFASKEEAVIGRLAPFEPSPAAIDRFVRGDGDVLTDLLELLEDAGLPDDDVAVHRLRRRLLATETALLGLRIASAHRFEDAIAGHVEQRLRRSGTAGEVVAERARLVVMVATAVVRHGWALWAAADGRRPLGECIRVAHDEFRATFAVGALDGAPAAVR